MVVPLIQLYKSAFITDWGHVVSIWSDAGLWELSFPRPDTDLAFADIKIKDANELPALGENCYDMALKQELNLYFRGFNTSFSVPIDWRGYSAFRTVVLKYTANIPYGEIQSYGAVAQAVGSPNAARAVGGAMHNNRTPIIVPCHRIVGSTGSLTGFGGGLDMKKALILLENEKYICQ